MRSDTVRMPGYKRACRFCGQLVDEDSVVCPFCTRAHPLVPVCPYCVAPIDLAWTVCNSCKKPLTVACPKCTSPVGPDTDVCEKCHAVVRYRCPACAVVVVLDAKKCGRCGAKLKDYWKAQGR